jgi:uncharacterized lipoprotein YbaY
MTNSVGSVTSSPASLTVSAAPVILLQPVSQTNVTGSDVTFTVIAAGASPLSYQWRFNSNNISGATSTSLTLTNLQLTNAGKYSVLVANSFGTTNSKQATLTIYMPPTILAQPTDQTVILSNKATFTVTATGTAPLTYQWKFNGNNVRGATRSSLTVTNVQLTNAGAYTVFLSNRVGTLTSTQAILTVLGAPIIVSPPTNQTVAAGASPTFNVTVLGDTNTAYAGLLAYQWRFNGGDLLGATGKSLTVLNAQLPNAGSYSVLVTNLFGSVTSSPAVLIVQAPAAIQVPPSNRVVIVSNSTTFTVVATGTPPLAYEWIYNGSPLSVTGSTFTISHVRADQAGGYAVKVSNPYGFDQSGAATLTVVAAQLTPIGLVSNHFSMMVLAGSNKTYVIQFASNANSQAWSPLITNQGSGGQQTIIDPAALAPGRFYRLIVQ